MGHHEKCTDSRCDYHCGYEVLNRSLDEPLMPWDFRDDAERQRRRTGELERLLAFGADPN